MEPLDRWPGSGPLCVTGWQAARVWSSLCAQVDVASALGGVPCRGRWWGFPSSMLGAEAGRCSSAITIALLGHRAEGKGWQ